MTAANAAPTGYQIASLGRATFVARADATQPLRDAGLDRPEGWESLTGARGARAGRGATATLELSGGLRLRLKQLRRGGALAFLWRERFPGARRLLDNLRVPLEASARGIPTPLPVVLLLLQGPPGLFRGWLGTEEIEGAEDLASRLAAGRPPGREEMESVLRTVRKMHDAGLDHRDLNLGNLLLAAPDGGTARTWVCDLDGARLQDGPLEFESRQRALRRLERSYVKVCASGAPSEEFRDGLYRIYAEGDPQLAARLERGRAAGRRRIGLHRRGWRR